MITIDLISLASMTHHKMRNDINRNFGCHNMTGRERAFWKRLKQQSFDKSLDESKEVVV